MIQDPEDYPRVADSPLLANIYMHRFLKYWFQQGMDERLKARVVNYADDFVILTRGHAREALAWTRRVMDAIGLSLNKEKTCICDASKESFDFLGYTFGPDHYPVNGTRYLSAKPSRKAVQKLKGTIRRRLKDNPCPWEDIVDMLNRKLTGWANYFSYGSLRNAYQAIDRYVYESVVRFLAKRHKLASQGWARISHRRVFGELGVKPLGTSNRRQFLRDEM